MIRDYNFSPESCRSYMIKDHTRSTIKISNHRPNLSLASSKSIKTVNTSHTVSILMLERYLSNICKTISSDYIISEASYNQLPSIKKILEDCARTSNISIEFYTLVETSLLLVSKIYKESCTNLIKELMQVLLKVFSMISKHQYNSNTSRMRIEPYQNMPMVEVLDELKIRMARITPRVINVKHI
jgi:hypothetical protein